MEHEITSRYYSIADIKEIIKSRKRLSLSREIRENIQRGANYIQLIKSRATPIYGVNTGFGSLCNVMVDEDRLSELQHNQLMSHACGVGPPVSEEQSRVVMFIKLLAFRTGHCGISVDVVQRLIDFMNHDVIPVIPKKGTVGASGDLAPLAHMALPVIGMGQVYMDGEIIEAAAALEKLGWKPLTLKPKEGLALTNGIQYLDAMAVMCLWDIEELVKTADLLVALGSQGFSTASTYYQLKLHALSKHKDRWVVARNLNKLLEGSNHYSLPQCDPAKEDPYSFRCVPQVHAAIRQTTSFAVKLLEDDCNSVSDSPLYFADSDEFFTSGNLHGETPAFAMDFLAIAMTELSNISERRSYQLLSGQHGLPRFLAKAGGLNSGMMVTQYTAAALLNENKVLSTPASIDTIPTCELQEDHVSMGGTSGYKLQQIISNLEVVFGIELLIAAQAIDMNKGLKLSPRTQPIYEEFREKVLTLEADRVMANDINVSVELLRQKRSKWIVGLE